MTDLVWVLSSCAVILAVFAIRAIFGKKLGAGVRYALWALVLIRLLIPGTVFQSPVSVENAVSRTELYENLEAVKGVTDISRSETGRVTGSTTAFSVPPKQNEGDSQNNTVTVTTAPSSVEEGTVVMENATPERFERMQKTLKIRDILSIVWVTGTVMTLVYFIIANVRFYLRLLRSRVRIEADCPVKVYSVDGLDSSCFFLNSIYVAKENAEDKNKLRYVLAHELSHRRHGDSIIAFFRCAALALHWYNPLVWMAAFASRRDSELFADAGAIGMLGDEARESYGRALIEFSVKPKVSANIAYAATTMTNGKSELKSRIKNIAFGKRTGAVIGIIVLVIGAFFLGVAFSGGMARAAEKIPAENRYETNVTFLNGVSGKLSFTLPEDYEVREGRPDEKAEDSDIWCVLYSSEGDGTVYKDNRVVGAYTINFNSDYEISNTDPEVIFSSLRLGHFRIRIEEKYDVIENDNSLITALTLATAIRQPAGNTSMAEAERFDCSVVIAYDPVSHLLAELSFLPDTFTEEELVVIAKSIKLSGIVSADTTSAPAVTQTPTEEAPADTPAPTAAPSPVPEGFYNRNDLDQILAFLEYTDIEGVSNGKKLFTDYDKNDPTTWEQLDSMGRRISYVDWSENGRISGIYHTNINDYSENLVLAGNLVLSGLSELKNVTLYGVTFDSLSITNCPKLLGCGVNSTTFTSELYYGSYTNVFLSSERRCFVSASGENTLGNEFVTENMRFTIDVFTDGGGYVSANGYMDEHYYVVEISAKPYEGCRFVGWYDEDGELVSEEEIYELNDPDINYGVVGDFKYKAVFEIRTTPVQEGDLCALINVGATYSVDMDGDGLPDMVRVSADSMTDGIPNYLITVTRASKLDEPFTYIVEGYEPTAAIVDFDNTDGKAELIVMVDYCSNDYYTYAVRFKDDGSGFEVFAKAMDFGFNDTFGYGMPEGYVFRCEEGLSMSTRTEILGTSFVHGRFTVTENGFEIISSEYTYSEHASPLTLFRSLDVTLENGKKLTLNANDEITPYSTDLVSFVKVKLSDGRIASISVSFEDPESRFPVLLNGVRQDEYAMIPYAD